MTKITPEHLTRGAYIYIRQSTADQLLHNHESRRRQYGLADRARHLGGTGQGSAGAASGMPVEGGKTSLSLTTTLAAQDPVSAGLALSACWRRFAKVGSAQCLPSRCRDWRVTGDAAKGSACGAGGKAEEG
jgi:hypothetical protein